VSSLLIIGGSGFFGKSILDAYRRGRLEKWKITRAYIFSRNARALAFSNPELLDESVSLINGDISTCDSLPKADYIIHAAASSDASKYISSPEREKANILSGTTNFCRLMALQESKASKILYVSSGAVYGPSSQNGMPFFESDEFLPLGEIDENKRHYSAAKRDSEAQIIVLGKNGLKVAIARCFAFIGKYLPTNQHFAIGNFIQNGMDQAPIIVKAQKKVYRSYMYADDLVEWLISIADDAKETCPIYNVGSDEAIEIRRLAALVGNFYSVAVEAGPLIGVEEDFYLPSIEKAKKELGLNVNLKIAEAIRVNDCAVKDYLKYYNKP
jgi:nucleoside-diphosphate-sugar epimerase